MLGLGEIQSLRSYGMSVVFMVVGAITLVSISRRHEPGEEMELLMKLNLEYLYGQILFTLTSQVQNFLAETPNYDLNRSLEASESVLHSLMEQIESNFGPFLAGAITVVGPLSPDIRDSSSLTLLRICQHIPDTVFAILAAGTCLVSLVQPSCLENQLCPSDLRLLINFSCNQPGLSGNSELWFPVCLPRFNSTGFLYAYCSYLDEETKLSLVLVSPNSSTGQFELFQKANSDIKSALMIPAPSRSVLRIAEAMGDRQDLNGGNVQWKRQNNDQSTQKVEASNYVEGDKQVGAEDKIQETDITGRCRILKEVGLGAEPAKMAEEFLHDENLLHFVFRAHIQVRGRNAKEIGYLPQCLSPALPLRFSDPFSMRRIWSMYQKLCLRMRVGSATAEAVWDAFDGVARKGGPPVHADDASVAMKITESCPETNGITYAVSETELFFAINGRGFELYAISPSTLSIKQAASSGAKLARAILSKSRRLFLTSPLTWKDY
jgi:hypothetical protein